MDKSQVTDVLEEIAVLLELKGENPFKARAYTNAARTLDTFEGDLGKLVAENRLGELAGIGDALQKKITELVTTGRLGYYEDLRASVPAGMLALMEIPSLGAKKINALHDKLGISSVAELEAACVAHKVRDLPGFGAKTEEKLLAGIQQARNYSSLFLYAEAWAQAEEIREALREHEDILQLSTAGSLRRGREVVHDLDFVASSREPEAVMEYFVSLPCVQEITNHGTTKSSVLLKNGMSADLRIVSDKEYAYALHHFTGSKEHNIAMRQRAIAQGKKLSEWGLFITPKKKKSEDDDGELVKCHTEEELFAALGLQYIPPELRENLGEIEAAEEKKIPRLVDWMQLRGTFHCHTNWSDGKNTLAEMAGEARELGLDYLGIADHSKSSFQANGLNEQRLAEQIDLIAEYNKQHPDFHVFTGSEVDILKDGRLDFPDSVLKKLDYVVASVHNVLNLEEDEMTARVIRAMENEYVTMLGHVTGRLLLAREASKINIEKVIDCAAHTGTIIELNCSSMRMDMDWRWWHRARDKGVKCSINPDAHRVSQFAMLRHGVTFARKGWLRREDVINTLPLADVKKALAR
ncbi:MAG TPA: DNA polymerase/3'-5' exonuclease PolX [Candidatus Methylacidiphilales bacterium]|nr:DNA polymerase/3'-5' exonuclease PolX [Candidatus Methylacidiphilales bacterium]